MRRGGRAAAGRASRCAQLLGLVLGLSLAGAPACGVYGKPVRSRPTQTTTAPARDTPPEASPPAEDAAAEDDDGETNR